VRESTVAVAAKVTLIEVPVGSGAQYTSFLLALLPMSILMAGNRIQYMRVLYTYVNSGMLRLGGDLCRDHTLEILV
jgi:hypothetical protein